MSVWISPSLIKGDIKQQNDKNIGSGALPSTERTIPERG